MKVSEERPLTKTEAAQCRSVATKTFTELEANTEDSSSSSWVRGTTADEEWLKGRSKECRYFDTNGFLVVPEFADTNMIASLKRQMSDLVDQNWDPSQKIDTFGTDETSNTARGDYFLDSSNRVHYFAEPSALDNEATPKQELNDKLSILNKAGHGMHNIEGAFRDYTLSQKMRELVIDLGWKDPVVPQSMYIFKQAKIGGTVHSHQDSSFLFTTPRQTCLGLWLALDDATLENGCLWARPGSHREPLRRQFLRNPKYFQDDDESAQKLIFQQHDNNPDVTWDGALPTSLLEEGFVPIEVKAGDLVTFVGTLDHLSLPNFSCFPRHTFQLHLVEGPKEDIHWSPDNWLQYPPGEQFVQLVP